MKQTAALFAFLGVLCAPATVAWGQESCTEVTFTDSYGPADPVWTSPLLAPRLQLQRIVLGSADTLMQVDVAVVVHAEGALGLENMTPNQCVAFPGWSVTVGVGTVEQVPGVPFIPFEASQLLTTSLEPYDGILDFGGTSGTTLDAPGDLTFERSFSLTEDLEAFIDSDPEDGTPEFIEFDHFLSADTSTRSSCSAISVWAAEAEISIEFRYTVCTSEVCPTGAVLQVGSGPGAGGYADTRVLATLHELRDRGLSTTARGRGYVDRFYRHAAEAKALFLNHPRLRARAALLLGLILPELEAALAEGRAPGLSPFELGAIDGLMRGLARRGSPDLRRTLVKLRAELASGELSDLVGVGIGGGASTSYERTATANRNAASVNSTTR